jgi:hypothetical protein
MIRSGHLCVKALQAIQNAEYVPTIFDPILAPGQAHSQKPNPALLIFENRQLHRVPVVKQSSSLLFARGIVKDAIRRRENSIRKYI